MHIFTGNGDLMAGWVKHIPHRYALSGSSLIFDSQPDKPLLDSPASFPIFLVCLGPIKKKKCPKKSFFIIS